MSVTTTGPVNPAQVRDHADPEATMACQGDPTQAGAVLWSSQITDQEITDAISAVTYDPNYSVVGT